jgi:hypothetical protein
MLFEKKEVRKNKKRWVGFQMVTHLSLRLAKIVQGITGGAV